MLLEKLEDAYQNKKITRLLLNTNKAVYGVFTGRINVVSNVTDSDVTCKYRYYFKEIDMDAFRSVKDIYKAMKDMLVIMQDQITDVEESIQTGFASKKYYI